METKWYKWKDRNSIPDKNQPAIYFIALPTSDISGNEFNLSKEIIYIGMTISQSGLKGRLNQFEKGMRGANGVHGGAERVRFKHKDPDAFFENAYVAAKTFILSKEKDTPDDWRIKGDCAGQEYKSFADYMELHGELPEFNDPKRSKKK